MDHIYPRNPKKNKEFYEAVHNVLSEVQVAYPVTVKLVRKGVQKGWIYRDAIKKKKFIVYILIPNTKIKEEHTELMVDRFIHEIAHVMHYQALHELGNDSTRIHDEGWGVYFSKAYCLAYGVK